MFNTGELMVITVLDFSMEYMSTQTADGGPFLAYSVLN